MRKKTIKAFTLLELMTTTAILIIAITGLLAIFTGLFSMNEQAKNLTLALTAAHGKLEEIRNTNFDSIYTVYNNSNFNPDGFPVNGAKGAIYIDNTDPSLLEITVSVSWRGRASRIIGEDINLNGTLNSGEDTNGDGRLSSPAEITTLMGQR